MQTKRCEELAARAREYERSPKQQYHAEGGGETEVWYETIHKHLEEILLPEIKRHAGELFVEYWPVRFVVDREHDLGQGVANQTLYNYEYGSHGTGYVCVTSRNVYLVVLDELTKLFPLNKPSLTGFLLNALSKQINLMRPFQGDHSRMLAPAQIQSVSLSSGRNETERIRLVTTAGTWELFEHFTDQRKEMLDAIECLRSSAFDALRPKWHVTKRPPILSEAELVRRVRNAPSFSLLPATPDATRAERGARLLDLHLLAAEVTRQGGAEVELDLAHAAAASPGNPQLRELRRAFAAMRHLLDRCATEAEILDTLHVRIDRIPELDDIYRKSVDRLARPYFKSWHPLPDRPHPALVRTIEIGDIHNPRDFGDAKFSFIWGHDVNTLFTGGNDGIVRIWDLSSSTVISSFEAFTPETGGRPYVVWIEQLVLSPDSKTLLAVSSGGRIKAWNTENWGLRFDIQDQPIDYCMFDANSICFAYNCHGSNTVRICDASTSQPLQHMVSFEKNKHEEHRELCSFRFGPSGDWMLVQIAEENGLNQQLIAVEMLSGKELFAFYCFDVHRFEISPNGDRVFVWGGLHNELRVWDITAGNWTDTLNVSSTGSWKISPSGKSLAICFPDGRAVIHDSRSGAVVCTLAGHLAGVSRCTFSPDERFLLSEDANNVLKLWDLTKANLPFVSPNYFASARVGEDVRRAKACAICNVNPLDGTVIVVNPIEHDSAILESASGKVSERHVEHPDTPWYERSFSKAKLSQIQYLSTACCACSTHGTHILLVGGDGWAIFDTRGLNIVHAVEGDFRAACTCALSSDRRWVAIAVENELRIWDLTTGHANKFNAERKINSCVFDPNAHWIIWASGDLVHGEPEVKKLDLDTGRICPFDNPLVVSKWFPSGRPALDDWGYILDCAVMSGGALVLAAHESGVVSVWDTNSLGLVNYWQAHNTGFPPKMACKPMPDNKTVLTAGSDGAVKLWEVATGKCLSVIQTEGVLEDCDCFPDGRRVVAAGEAGVYWLEIVGV